MYCPDCGKENPAGQKFCRSCGLSLKPISQALAGKVVPADWSIDSNPDSRAVIQAEPRFWQNPLIYALLLIVLGTIIAVVGDNVFHTSNVTDIGKIIALLGVGLLGFKGVLLVIRPPRSSTRPQPAPHVEDTSKLTPPLLSAEPPSITENTTRQLDAVETKGRTRPRSSTS